MKKARARQPPVLRLQHPAAPLLEIPLTVAAAAHCPLLWRAPTTPVVVLHTTIHPSGVGCRLCVTTGSGNQWLSAYGGLLLDVRGTLLQVSRPIVETYASIDRQYGLDETTFLALAASFLRHFIEHMVYDLVMFLVADVRRSTCVRKAEKSIMERFKWAFAAPWPKTLRYQMTEGRYQMTEGMLDSLSRLLLF
jgi:hypothetical protein